VNSCFRGFEVLFHLKMVFDMFLFFDFIQSFLLEQRPAVASEGGLFGYNL
jgi:hypothetical protein